MLFKGIFGNYGIYVVVSIIILHIVIIVMSILLSVVDPKPGPVGSASYFFPENFNMLSKLLKIMTLNKTGIAVNRRQKILIFQLNLKVPKCEILMSWISMIFLS